MKIQHIAFGLTAATALSTVGLFAQAPSTTFLSDFGSVEFVASAGFVANADTVTGGSKTGDVDISHFRITAIQPYRLSPTITLEGGIHVDYLDINTSSAAVALPDELVQVALVIGATWQINPDWELLANVRPGLYGDGEVSDSDRFNVPFNVMARWTVNPALALVFGVRVNPFADDVVMPVASLRWQIDESWLLTAGVPRTEIAYAVNDRLSVFGGVGVNGGTYATDDPGIQAPAGRNLRDTKVDVSEFNASVGATWKLTPRLSLRVEGGYVFEREFDYYDRNVKVEPDDAAFVSLSLTASF
ncbi:hypothetical protein OpiT1DRAFT_01504 [Opitutaceae bacterium TAV1]|nr:hypothetical protein OpiT1DRAFT_01504 [Opitutaceae bacterium TAV1]